MSVHALFCRQKGVGSSRLGQLRANFFSVDFALDVAVSNLVLLTVCEGQGVAVPSPRYGQRLLALECSCVHYHLQAGVTGDQTLSMDVEVRQTNCLLSAASGIRSAAVEVF